MNQKKKALLSATLATLIAAGSVTAQQAFAHDEGHATPKKAKKAKNACGGKKNACGGKDGCKGKENVDKKPADAPTDAPADAPAVKAAE
jgi:hypothetical protein